MDKRLLWFLPMLAVFSIPVFAQFPSPSQGGNTGLWNDQSATVASVGGANLVSHASRFNHLLVGEASTANASFSSSPKSWMDNYIDNFVVGSQIGVTSTLGLGALGSASRTSDLHTALGGASGGSAGGYFFGVNDNSTAGNIALGSNSVGLHQSSGDIITLGAQQDINSIQAPGCVPNPDSTLCASGASTIGNLITSGAFGSPHVPNLASQDIGAALVFGSGSTQKFFTGLVVDTNALRTGQGPNILGSNSTPAIALNRGYYIIWYNGAAASSAVWGGGSGNLNFFGNNLVVNGVAAVNCGPGAPTAGFTVTNGIVTAC